jgi:hypothetical protein
MSGRGRSGGWAVLLVGVVICLVAPLAGARGDVVRTVEPGAVAPRVGSAGSEGSHIDVPSVGSIQADALAGVLQAIDACVVKLNPDVDIGYDRVAARCPTLVHRVGESGVSAWLPRDWQRAGNDLSVGGLRELRRSLTRELSAVGGDDERGRAPSAGRVQDVLASLARSDGERSGWWARTRAWLRGVFERGEPAAEEGWLARMVGESGASQTVIELISYVALVLVAVLAVVIVVNELRVSGVFGGLRRRLAVLADVPVAAGRGGLTWDDVQKAPVLQRAGVLLELLVAKLAEGARFRSARGLTVRELTRAAPLGDEGDRERLLLLARTAERVRFGGEEVSGGEVEAAVEGGRVLLERLGVGGGVRGGGLQGAEVWDSGAAGGPQGARDGGR